MGEWIAKEAASIEECHESLIDRLFNFMASHHSRSGTTRLSRLPVQLNATAVMGSKEDRGEAPLEDCPKVSMLVLTFVGVSRDNVARSRVK